MYTSSLTKWMRPPTTLCIEMMNSNLWIRTFGFCFPHWIYLSNQWRLCNSGKFWTTPRIVVCAQRSRLPPFESAIVFILKHKMSLLSGLNFFFSRENMWKLKKFDGRNDEVAENRILYRCVLSMSNLVGYFSIFRSFYDGEKMASKMMSCYVHEIGKFSELFNKSWFWLNSIIAKASIFVRLINSKKKRKIGF